MELLHGFNAEVLSIIKQFLLCMINDKSRNIPLGSAVQIPEKNNISPRNSAVQLFSGRNLWISVQFNRE